MALRLHTLAEITGNLLMESKIRDVLKQLYKKSYRGLQYFLDSCHIILSIQRRKTIPSHASVFLLDMTISKEILWKSCTQIIIVPYFNVFNVEVFKFHTYSPVSMYIGTQTNVITYQTNVITYQMCILLSI